jgi:hypothetical protein
MYCGLEDNKALERAMRNPAPERLAHLARPDLDAASAAVVQRRYLEAVGDQRSARALVMQARAQQREAHARQRAELRGLEQALQTPFALARAREAARLGAQAHGAALARPQFADVAELERTIASAMTSARGQARMGAASTHVKERERAVRALMQLDQSALMHAPADAHAPTNALARARDNVARAQSAQAGRRPPLLRRAELHALIARLLDEKVRADGVDDLARRGRQSLSEIVHDDLSRTHALRELAAAQEATLRQSCVALHHASERVRLFAAAMGWLGAAAWPAARVGVWLSFLKRVFPPSQGRLRERLNDPGEVMVPWRDFEAAIRETFDSELLAVRSRACNRTAIAPRPSLPPSPCLLVALPPLASHPASEPTRALTRLPLPPCLPLPSPPHRRA